MIAQRIAFQTIHPTETVDLTGRIRDAVRRTGLREGRVHLQSLHPALGLTLNEDEPAQQEDLQSRAPLTGFATVLVEDGEVLLGRGQSVLAVELDGPGRRELALQLEGDFAAGPGRHAPDARESLLEVELARQLMADPEPVAAPMRRLVEAGGKRLRPKLVQLTAGVGPRTEPLRAAELAAAIELLHNATLVHDDYVDESTHRRGRPTVAAAEGPERAIAVGDYYFAKATRLVAEIGNRQVTSEVAEALEAICASQIDDVALRGAFPGDRDSYLKVVRGKTAALFSAACASGALLSEASSDVVGALRRYGDLLGTAFQMADDMVDFSPSSGKPVGLDIRQRTLSLPLIYAAEDRTVGPEVRRLLEGSLGDAEVERVAELVTESGALQRVRDEAVELAEAAVHELEAVELDGLRPALVGLARSAVDRSS